jgi:tetratricopeptide (TPR) repeat protein
MAAQRQSCRRASQSGAWPPALRAGLVALLIWLAAVPLALAQTSPRGAEHDTFGRIVFDWPGPVRWSADVTDGKLVARFEKPVAGDPAILVKALDKYLKDATLSADRRMVTFTLSRPVQLKTFTSGNSTVIDLQDKGGQPAPAQAQPPKPAERPTDLMVRGGEHTGFNRLVFDWPKPVAYSINATEGRAVIAFDRPANVNVTALETSLPADVKLAGIAPEGKGTAITLTLPAGMRVRHFTSGPKVAVDLVRAVGSAPPPRAEGVAPPPLAPPPGAGVQPQATNQPPAEEPAPVPPAAVAGPSTATSPPLPEPVKAEEPPKKDALLVSLGVGFDQPTGAAAFRRAGWLWLVFDRKADIDTKLLKRTGGEVVQYVENVPNVHNGTAIRMITLPGYNPSVRKEGQLWVFDLTEQPLIPKSPLAINRQYDFEDRGRLMIPIADSPSKPVVFRDPEVGDLMQVMAITTVGAGVAAETVVPGAELLPTAQGIAMIPQSDGARLDAARNAVEVSMPGGLYLSRNVAPTPGAGAGEPTGEAQVSSGGPLDLLRWMRGGLDEFVPEHQKLLNRFILVKPADKNAQRLEIARHFLANGMAAEALGELKIIAANDPTMLENPNFLGPRGVANFMMRRDQDALADLGHPSLAKDPQGQLWLAAVKAQTSGEPAKQALMLRLAGTDIKGLNPRLRMTLGTISALSAAAAGDYKAAYRIIESMNGPGLSRRDTGEISYLQGVAAEAGKQWDQAITRYREAEESESRPARAHAGRNRIELQLRRGMITTAEAARQLEKLRFAWREGDYEYQLLKRLTELIIKDERWADGLRLARNVTELFPDHPDIPTIQKMMSDTFEKLFLGGAADKLSPVAAIGLYDEFQELTPPGEKGDEMIRKLADRLASVDLLDRSAELLRHQVQFRTQGVEKARIGARLAYLDMANNKPAQALESLNQSEVPGQPNDLYDQRRYMRVRALADLGRSAEALALIVNDHADRANQLRAEIYWDLKKWPEAAQSLETLVEKPEGASPIQPVMARHLIDLATAYTLARDERGLQRLRRDFGAKMAATKYREAFDLLTSEAERGILDYRRVADKIKQVEEFQGFMADWKNRVQTQGLSSIN